MRLVKNVKTVPSVCFASANKFAWRTSLCPSVTHEEEAVMPARVSCKRAASFITAFDCAVFLSGVSCWWVSTAWGNELHCVQLASRVTSAM
jgi:hypothetical protein